MGTRALVYINGECLCWTFWDSYPDKLGEVLERVSPDWKTVLSACREFDICYLNSKFFIKDPNFSYRCFTEKRRKDYFPDGLTDEIIDIIKKGDLNALYSEEIIGNFPDELYESPAQMDVTYNFNIANNNVFIRKDYKNFPWVLNSEEVETCYQDRDLLDNILFDMCGFLDAEEDNWEIRSKVRENGPICSGRHYIQACKKATQLLAEDPNSWWNYGVALEISGKLEQAIESYKKAKKLTPTNPKIWQILGNAYLKNANKELAFKAFEKAITIYKILDFEDMDYYQKKDFRENLKQLYKILSEEKLDNLIQKLNKFIHNKIPDEEIKVLELFQKQIGSLLFSNFLYEFFDYKVKDGHIIELKLNGQYYTSDMKIKTIPDSIGALSFLEKLDLSNNRITSLLELTQPSKSLQELDLRGNIISHLPKWIQTLPLLKKLDLRDNKFYSYPEWLKTITSLEQLEIDPVIPEIDPKENEFLEIIEDKIKKPLPFGSEIKEERSGYVVKGGHIVELSLYYKRLSSIPDSIGDLTSLEELNLTKNDLTSLPETIGNLTLVKKLNLSDNKFILLPEPIGNLTSLKELNLKKNKLTVLSGTIGYLTSLKKLNLEENILTSLPETILTLSSLRELNFNKNKIKDLPESIGNLISLEILNLYFNKLTSLPESIGSLTSLKELNLMYNNLISLPESIGNLSSLEKLNLNGNKLTSLPETIGSLTSLEELDISNNKLNDLPDSIGSLTSLKSLDLYFNKLTSLPESIGALTSLKKLNLSHNELKSLPDSIGSLTSLKKLKLSHNKLTSLPDSFESLTALEEIDLKDNQLMNLPDSLKKFEKNGLKILKDL